MLVFSSLSHRDFYFVSLFLVVILFEFLIVSSHAKFHLNPAANYEFYNFLI